MYYDINKIINEELAGIDILLNALATYDAQEAGGYLTARVNDKRTTYHLRKKTSEGKIVSKKLGEESSPEVIKVKQDRFVSVLKRTLIEDKKLLM